MALLDKWDTFNSSDNTIRLVGRVYGHGTIQDGDYITTTPVLELAYEYAMTHDEIYTLGEQVRYEEI